MSHSLQVRGLSVHAAGPALTCLVRDISFAIEPGQSLTLLGESGSGKSLLAQAVMGNLPRGLSASGEVRLGEDVAGADQLHKRRAWWGRRLAMLPQEPWLALDPTMPAQAQVAETHHLVGGLPSGQARRQAGQDLARLGLAHAGNQYPFMLSGGMAQRVAFAATCAGGAPVLIVDEPTKGLDAELRDQVVDLLRDVLRRGGCVLAITHDVAVARALNGQIAVMLEAEVVERGNVADVLANPQHAYTRRLLAAEPSAWSPQAARERADAPVLLAARGLSKRYGQRTLFSGIDLAVHTGERLAIVGRSGSGKTTLGNILLGLSAPDHGSVTRAARIGRTGFQKLYQDPSAAFAPTVTLRRSLLDLLQLHRIAWSEIDALMQQLRLAPALLERRPDQVSGGELQRFALMRVLLLKPALIFADEPTSRLDPLIQKETFDLLLRSLDERESALVLVTHDAEIARNVTGRSLQIDPGAEAAAR